MKWRKKLKRPENPKQLEELEDYKFIDQIDDMKKPSKFIYDKLIKEKFIEPKEKSQKWADDLGIQPNFLEDMKFLNKNNKIRSYSYNFYMRNVPYERKLQKMGIKDTNKCRLCGKEETLLHLYWECQHSRRLWERLKNLLQSEINIKITLNPASCLLGRQYEGPGRYSNMLINILCLLTKHYIHMRKCKDEVPSYQNLINYIKKTYDLEWRLARQRGTQNQINIKWKECKGWITPTPQAQDQ